MVRRVATGVVIVLLTVSAVALVPTGSATNANADGTRSPLTTPEGFANAEFEIRIFANGSARWSIRASRPLTNQTEVERFRQFARTFESDEAATFRTFKENARELAAVGTEVTGRDMNATGFSRDARVVRFGQTRGVIELSFVWTNFGRTEGERVVAGDVFEGGFFVDTGQRVVVSRGPNLVFDSVSPPPDSQEREGNRTASETVTWIGERQFADKRPHVELVPPETVAGGDTAPSTATPGAGTATQGSTATATTGSQATTPTTTRTPGSGTSPSEGLGMLPFAVVFVVLLGLGGGLAWYSGAMPQVGPAAGGTASSTSSPSSTDADSPPQRSDPEVTEEELLSDEDRVLELLDDNGGRMKQVNIVEETDWSKSKVSMLLSDMEEAGLISKLRVGRENIISKSGEEPEAAGSPFEEK